MKVSLDLVKRLSVPVLSLVFASAYFISTFSLPGIAANYPRGLIVIIVFLSLWLAVSELKKSSEEGIQGHSRAVSLREFKRPILGQFVLLLYFIAAPYVGFYVCSFVWMIVTAAVIDPEMRWRGLGYDIVICALFILCAYLVFKVIFFVPTPEGIWM
jgi:Tripartite tricarboxylate transporter TctB family